MFKHYADDFAGALPRVSHILDSTLTDEQRYSLVSWYAKNPLKAVQTNEQSQERGNQVDAWAKAYLAGLPLPVVDYPNQAYLTLLQPLLESMRSLPNLLDRYVADPIRCYAGTLDIALLDGSCWRVVELKTKRRIYGPAMWAAKLQATAYREALALEGFPVGPVLVVAVTVKEIQLFSVDEAEQLELSHQWQLRLDAYHGRPR